MLKKLQNESQMDRIIRIALGVVLAIAGYAFLTGVAQIVVYVLALIAIFTGVTGFCLLYKISGISTIKK
jgi:VIT1/CCC1 family predicted Fe2+/Mn2+ transporter